MQFNILYSIGNAFRKYKNMHLNHLNNFRRMKNFLKYSSIQNEEYLSSEYINQRWAMAYKYILLILIRHFGYITR